MTERFYYKMGDENLGLYPKYVVERVSDPTGKHKDCPYYVLDFKHDKFAISAIEAYATACEIEYPKLAEDLRGLKFGLS